MLVTSDGSLAETWTRAPSAPLLAMLYQPLEATVSAASIEIVTTGGAVSDGGASKVMESWARTSSGPCLNRANTVLAPSPPLARVQLKSVVGEVGTPEVHPSGSLPGQFVPAVCTTVHGPADETLLKASSSAARSPPGGKWSTATVTVTAKLLVEAAPPLIEIDWPLGTSANAIAAELTTKSAVIPASAGHRPLRCVLNGITALFVVSSAAI